MKNMKKLITFLLVIAMLTSLLAACDSKEPNTKESGEQSSETLPPSPVEELAVIEDAKAAFKVIYAHGERGIAELAMQHLSSSLEEAFGVKPEKAQVYSASVEGTCIIFGNTGGEHPDGIYKNLRNRDYSISVHEGKIHILALNEESYVMAVNSFVSMLKQKAGEVEQKPLQSLSIRTDYSTYMEGRYTIMSVKVENVELKEFFVLKPTDPTIDETLVTKLIDNVALSYGFTLEQKVRPAEGQHYLKMEIDKTMDPLHYGCSVVDGHLVLRAGGPYSMKFAVRDIISLIRTDNKATELTLNAGEIASVSLLDNPDGLAKPTNSNLRLMSCNVMATYEGWDSDSPAQGISFEMRTEIFDSYLKVYDPDVLGLQEVCPTWRAHLDEICGEGSPYKYATGGGTRIVFLNPILYRADRYKLITEGWINYSVTGNSQAWGGRYMTWAVFESIATGERFGLVNVHWAGWSKPEANEVQARETLAKMKELHEAYNCPITSTGDYNTRDFDPSKKGDATVPTLEICDPAYADLIKDGTVKDAKFYCEKQVNDIGSVHAWGPTAYPRVYSFDHIFCTSDTTVRQFYSAWDNQQRYAADHAWLIADIDLSTKKTQ